MTMRLRQLIILFLALLPHHGGAQTAQTTQRTGAAIYTELCVSCHGDSGQGVAGKYDESLYGEKSVAALARYIDRTMPEEAPEKCVGEDAHAVAQYIFDAFYSPAARARLHPPRIELAHLTVRQMRESTADLLGTFRTAHPPGPTTGLQARYFQSEGMNKKAHLKLEREDPAIDFDFGSADPVPGCAAEQFSISWKGSLHAPETGHYEFRITTPNGARLYLNAEQRSTESNQRDDSAGKRQPALIDSWVSSGPDRREAKARTYLLGGRIYPLRVDYFKFKEKSGFIRLEWKPPHGHWTTLSAPYLSPSPASRVTVLTTSFPPDDGSLGYERGSAVSSEWLQATTNAAIETAQEVTERIHSLTDTDEDSPDIAAEVRNFAEAFVRRAFRRPLTPEDKDYFIHRHFTPGLDPSVALRRVVLLALTSPRYLYIHTAQPTPDSYTIAARLALYLWGSLPDQPLLDAASRDELTNPETLRQHAERMLPDPRTHAQLHGFFHDWLSLEEAEDINKDRNAYPDFDEAVIADLRTSLQRFIDHTVWSPTSDYRQLLTSHEIWVNPRLATFLRVPPPPPGTFQPASFDPAQRAGVFTHPYLLAAFSYHKSTSPIHRGVFLTRNILGRFLKPPPMAISFMDDRFDPTLTMREKVTDLTRSTNCMACHSTINPLGFSLENYDAVGRWRTVDNHKPVNSESEYLSADGDTLRLRGPRDVAAHAAASPSARRGFIRRLFQYTIKQQPSAYSPDLLQKLDDTFAQNHCHIRQLLVAIATRTAAHGR